MSFPEFLGLSDPSHPESAQALMLPLPFEGTVSFGSGTAAGPLAIWEASRQVEDWDEELDFDLATLKVFSADAVEPTKKNESPEGYLDRVRLAAVGLHGYPGLVFGVGGEHSVTPPLVRAAIDARGLDAENLTVVQIDAHADLRAEYEGTKNSHACAMRRVVEDLGAGVLAIGIRSAERAEMMYGRESGLVETYYAHELADPAGEREAKLMKRLGALSGDVYLTIDIDGLDVHLCPGTGTPQPGGLGWWQTLRYCRRLIRENKSARLVGVDIVETVPMPNTQVNEFVAARLALKLLAYRWA